MRSKNEKSTTDSLLERNYYSLPLFIGEHPAMPDFWFRGDARLPESIFAQGFKARGKNVDLLNHFAPSDSFGTPTGDSALISTSTSKNAALRFPIRKPVLSECTYLYDVKSQSGAVDGRNFARNAYKNGDIGKLTYYPLMFEKEKAVFWHIKPQDVRGAWEVSWKMTNNWQWTKGLGSYMPNPHYLRTVEESIWIGGKFVGKYSMPVAAAMEGWRLYGKYQQAREAGDYTEFKYDLAKTASVWGGAAIGGVYGAIQGALSCPVKHPVGMAFCAGGGGLLGTIAGAEAGAAYGETFYRFIDEPPNFSKIFSTAAEAAPLPQSKGSLPTMTKTTTARLSTKPSTTQHMEVNPISTRMRQIAASQVDTSYKVTQLLGEIRAANQFLLEQRQLSIAQQNQQQIRENFQSVMDGFNCIVQIGAATGNKTVAKFGEIGGALTQMTFGVATLTGSMGLTAPVTALGMVTPITAIVSGGFVLASAFGLFGGNKKKKREAKAMQKMFKGLSDQMVGVHKAVNEMHRNMGKGFEAVLYGMDTLNDTVQDGISSIHNALLLYFSRMGGAMLHHYETLMQRLDSHVNLLLVNQGQLFDFMTQEFAHLELLFHAETLQLNQMDMKLDKILAQIQQLGLEAQFRQRQATMDLAERYHYGHDKGKLLKLLQEIKTELVQAKAVTHLPIQGNSLSGWFHLGTLVDLFSKTEFHSFPFELTSLTNLVWAEPVLTLYLTIISRTDLQNIEDEGIKTINNEIMGMLEAMAKPTETFIRAIGSKEFLTQLFTYYSNRLEVLNNEAEVLLKIFRENYTHEAMQAYKDRLLTASIDKKSGEEAAKSNSKLMVASLMNGAEMSALRTKVLAYNNCVKAFQNHVSILLSLLAIDEEAALPIQAKLNAFQPIPELHYTPESRSSADNSFTYLHMDTANHFGRFPIVDETLTAVCEEASDYCDSLTDGMGLLNNLITHHAIVRGDFQNEESPYPLYYSEVESKDTELKDNLHPETISPMLSAMNTIHESASKAKGRKVVYVFGISGEGKSTFLNAATDSRYRPVRVDGDWVAEWDPTSTKEQCKVGSADKAESETLTPQLVEVPFGKQTITYCDLPGLEGSREGNLRVCESFAPMMINQEVEEVQGIVWVLSDDTIKAAKSKLVKELLTSLLKIAKGNPQTILNSLTILVTKGAEDLTKEDVLAKLRKAVAAMHNKDEKDLLNQIIEKMAKPDNHSIVISQLYDSNSFYLQAVHQSVLANTPQDKTLFDFSLYSKEQAGFAEQLSQALQHWDQVEQRLAENQALLDNWSTVVEMNNGEARQLVLRMKQCQTALDEIHEKRKVIAQLYSNCQREIQDLERSEERVVVQTINGTINGQTYTYDKEVTETKIVPVDKTRPKFKWGTIGYKKEEERRMLFPEHGYFHGSIEQMMAIPKWAKKIQDKTNQGWTIEWENLWDKRHGRRVKAHAIWYKDVPIPGNVPDGVETYKDTETKTEIVKKPFTESVPQGHALEFPIIFPATYPMEVNGNTTQGWTIKPGSEQRLQGYAATAVYQQGEGCNIKVTISAARKHAPATQKQLDFLKAQEQTSGRQIANLDRTCLSLEEKIEAYKTRLAALSEHAPNAEKQKRKMEEDCQALRRYLDENRSYFERLQQLQALVSPDASKPKARQQTSVVPFSLFASARPKIDRSWYDDETINFLLNHYLADVNVDILTGMLGTDWLAGNTLCAQLSQYMQRDNSKKALIPVNLGTYEGQGVHWVLLYIDASTNIQKPHVTYVEPFGESMHAHVENALAQVFSQFDKNDVINPGIKFQNNHYDCGVWVVEFARHLLSYDGHVPHEEFNIQEAREEHSQVIMQSFIDNTIA